MKELEIIIDKMGEIRVHVKGVKGSACLDYTKWLEELGHVIGRDLTEEYYESEVKIDQSFYVSNR